MEARQYTEEPTSFMDTDLKGAASLSQARPGSTSPELAHPGSSSIGKTITDDPSNPHHAAMTTDDPSNPHHAAVTTDDPSNPHRAAIATLEEVGLIGNAAEGIKFRGKGTSDT